MVINKCTYNTLSSLITQCFVAAKEGNLFEKIKEIKKIITVDFKKISPFSNLASICIASSSN